ncbi:MAG TPA: signal peptide peptidase SppA [bacterium]|nr:signal peptide peptidase SppA [bacterium]
MLENLKPGTRSWNLGTCAGTCALALVILAALAGPTRAVELPPYNDQNEFMLTAPGMIGWEDYGLTNPATLATVSNPDLMFAWRGSKATKGDLDRWGAFGVLPNLGIAALHQRGSIGSVTDYHLGVAFGDRRTSFGLSYAWATGDKAAFDRGKTVGIGALARPVPYLSLGLAGRAATQGGAKEGSVAIGCRPTGTDLVTIFGDYAIQKGEIFRDGAWSAGAALRMMPGIYLTGRYFDKSAAHGFTAGLAIDLGNLGLASQAHYDNDQHRAYNTYRVRAGAYHRSVIDTNIMPRREYLELDLSGPITYQPYQWFDKSHALVNILSTIEAAKHDPRIAGIAINASGMIASREVAWEVREKLRDFKSSGKHVVIFMESGGIDAYHFASVADKIMLDPTAVLTFEGFAMGRTFLKGTLAKLGLSFDEWRFFTYKSADEVLSRDSMSEPDREQRQRLVDEYYSLAKSDICASGRISPEEFDRLVNEQLVLLPQEALAKGLVDTLARADAFPDVIKRLDGKKKPVAGPGVLGLAPASLVAYGTPSDAYWGDRPHVAVIYAIGECAMDTGIKARSLAKTIEGVTRDGSIKAVVFRADSPGGDGTASDIVAEALKKCSKKKPVIVSQGAVAGSGGYWISMYGDKIVAAPQTITGSIGVIGGWLYNFGLKEKLGLSTDLVKDGNHADLGFGATLPFIGATVPDRNLSDQERTVMEHAIRDFYKDFVTKVAAGRHMKYEDVDKIGQGRVWPGVDGKQNGLIDELGGFETALELAKQQAGIARDAQVKLVQLPRPQLFNASMFTPKLIGVTAKMGLGRLLGIPAEPGLDAAAAQVDPILSYLKFRLEHNGQPLPMLPADDLEMIMQAQGPAGN